MRRLQLHRVLQSGIGEAIRPTIGVSRPERAQAAPTWLARAPLHAAAISCCVLPVASARTWSPRFDELCLPPADFAVVVGGRPCRRAGAAAFVAVAGVL